VILPQHYERASRALWRWVLLPVLVSTANAQALPETLTLYWASSRTTTTPTPIAPTNPAGPSFTVPFPNTAATSGITIAVQAPETIPGVTLSSDLYRIDPPLEITFQIAGTMLSGTGPNFVFRGIGGNSCGVAVNRNLNTNLPFTRTVTCRYTFEIRSATGLDLLFNAESGSARVDIRLNYVVPRDMVSLSYAPNASGQQASLNPTPDPSRPLDLAAAPSEGYTFCGFLTTSLGSRDRADGALRVVDQAGVLVATSEFFPVTRSGLTTSARRCTAPARIPASVTLLRMRGVLIDPRLPSNLQTIAESTVVEYRVAGPAMRLTNITPRPENGLPRGETVTFSGVVENYPSSIPNTALVLLLLDKDRDGALLRTSNFVNLSPGQTAPVTLEIRNFSVAKEVQDVFIKAAVIDRGTAQIIAESASTRYAPDVSIDRIELVQVVQTEAHDVPLIAGKSTVMRIFVKQAGHLDDLIPRISAGIKAFRGFTELAGTPTPLGFFDTIRAREKPDRARGEDSLNYLLPQSWVPRDSKEAEAPYSYEVELQLPADRPEGPKSNNLNRDKPLSTFYQGTFEPPRPLRIALVKVCVGEAPNIVCPKSSLRPQLDYFRKVYPLNFHSVYVDPGYEINLSEVARPSLLSVCLTASPLPTSIRTMVGCMPRPH
jgi:hypothetical protein